MKKMIIMLVLSALAFVTQANIVNSGFDIAQTNTPPNVPGTTLSGNPISTTLNRGWGTNAYGTTASSPYMQISGGIASRNTGGPGQLAGIVQFYTDSQTGTNLALQYDLQIVDDNSSDSFYIQLYGYKYQSGTFSGSSVMTASDGAVLKINSTGAFGASTNWVITALVDYKYSSGTLNGGAWTTGNTLSFLDSNVIAGEYDMYGIRITTLSGAGDVINVDNVSVVAIPEPATALLFGIGGFGAWMLRRNSRKAREHSED